MDDRPHPDRIFRNDLEGAEAPRVQVRRSHDLYAWMQAVGSSTIILSVVSGAIRWRAGPKAFAVRGLPMFVDHAATALLIKRRYPSVPLAPILVSVQAMELAWVGLNYLGIERTTTEATVRSVADVHLAYMPYSHSVATGAGAAIRGVADHRERIRSARVGPRGRPRHRVAPDPRSGDACPRHRALARLGGTEAGPWLVHSRSARRIRRRIPVWIFSWYVYRGGRGLLVLISLGNLANLSFLSPAVPGPEEYLAGRPMLLVTVIFAQIVVTLVLVGLLAARPAKSAT